MGTYYFFFYLFVDSMSYWMKNLSVEDYRDESKMEKINYTGTFVTTIEDMFYRREYGGDDGTNSESIGG